MQGVREVLASLSVSVPTIGTVGLPAVVVDAVIGEVTTQLAGSLIDKIADPIPGTFGRCGGMAFAGYDFYLLGWTVDERLGTMPPVTGPLSDYLFGRLLDSLDLNAVDIPRLDRKPAPDANHIPCSEYYAWNRCGRLGRADWRRFRRIVGESG